VRNASKILIGKPEGKRPIRGLIVGRITLKWIM
jgi:hypothetical protein